MRHRRSVEVTWRPYVGRLAPLWAVGFLLLLAAVTTPAAGVARSPAVVRLAATDQPLTEYRALRRMHARNEKLDQEGWLDAWTELDHAQFRYRILSERGSEQVRNKVLRAVLKGEQQLIAQGETSRAALTDANYVFSEATHGADGLVYVPMKPRRKDVVLVDGRMVLSPDGTELRRVEGRLAKNPSFWTSGVTLVRHFATVDGVRVPVTTETVARLKFLGESRMKVSYDYESINGRPVSLAARRTLASAAAGRAPQLFER